MRKHLGRLSASSPGQVDAALLVLRVWFGGIIAVNHGLGKVRNLGGLIESVAAHGFPLPSVMGPFAALSELAGGLLLVVGLLTRPAGIAIVGTMLGAAFVVHAGDPFMDKEFALCFAVGAAALVIAGPGRYSLDHKLFGSGR